MKNITLLFVIPAIAFFVAFVGPIVTVFGVLPYMAHHSLGPIPALPFLEILQSPWLGGLLKQALLVLAFVMPVASLLTWTERRQSAMMQDRLGPNRAALPLVGKLIGIPHFIADAVKMIMKEDFIPAKANKVLFQLAPVIAVVPVLLTFAIIPFGGDICVDKLFEVVPHGEICQNTVALQTARLDVGILFYFAIASLAVYGTTLAGWSSYNKWSLLGGLRASSQMMSYEVTMGLAVLGALLVYGSLEPGAIVVAQGPNPLNWGIITQPLGAILFFVAAVAETKRTPFDIPEGESEVIGYFVEYSGMRFGVFFLAEFIEVIFTGAIMSTIFFGGWQVPFLYGDGFHLFGHAAQMPHIAVIALQVLAWCLKIAFFCWFQLLIRWTLPRFRADQLMRLGWKQLLPASLVNIVVTALVVLYMQAK